MSDERVIEVSSFIRSVWWLVLLRGVFAIVLGILAFVWPVATAIAFVWVFGVYALVDGAFTIAHAVATRRSDPRWGWMLAIGVVGVIAGVVAMVFPAAAGAFALLVLLWTIAIWAVVDGIFGIPAAASLASGGAKTLGILFSVVSILFGVLLAVLLVTTPLSALIGLIFVLGWYAIIAGVVLIVIAVQARRAAGRIDATA
ncbi:MAG: HdeD family acid-resistance protein [Microbacteriaceae bacterium]|nr:MAG: HdeD family acid-resistance protein [Microbacteriaceae bacterium]